GQRERQIAWTLEQRSYRGEPAPQHANAMAVGGRHAQRAEIGQPPHLAVDERIAHRALADADRLTGLALARDDEAVRCAQAEVGRKCIRLALERQPHPAAQRVLAQQSAEVGLVLALRDRENEIVGDQRLLLLSGVPPRHSRGLLPPPLWGRVGEGGG